VRISIGHIRHEGGQSNVTGRRVQINLDDLVPVEIDPFGASVSHFNGDCYDSGMNPSTYDYAIVNAVREPISCGWYFGRKITLLFQKEQMV
jgi:hypothetical protein